MDKNKKTKNKALMPDYEDIFNQVNDLIQQCDRKGVVINANDAWFKTLGYKKGDIGKVNIKDVVVPEHKEECFKGLKKVFLGERIIGIDIVLVSKEGKRIYTKASAAPFKNSRGEIISTLTIFRDVSLEKKAETIIELEREKLQNYLNVAGVMMVSLDATGKIELINKKGCEILEDKQENIIGKNWFDNFLPKGIKKEVFQVFKKLMIGKFKTVEYYENEILTKNKNKKTISFHNTIIKNHNGKISGILFSGEDITTKKIVEQEILSYQNKLETIFDASNDMIVYTDLTGNVVDVNSRVKEFLGFNRESVIGKNVFKLKVIHSSSLLKLVSLFKKSIKSRKMVNPVELSMVKRDGQRIYVEASTNFVRKNNKISGVVSLIRDISEKRKAAEIIKENNSRLQSLMESIKDSVCLLDKNYKYLYANIKHLSRLEKNLKDIIGKDYKNFHSASDYKEFFSKANNVFKNGDIISYEHKSECDNHYFLRTISPIMASDGSVLNITVLSRDITEEKEEEEKNKIHAEELERLNNLMVGRELKMIELKKKVNELMKKDNNI